MRAFWLNKQLDFQIHSGSCTYIYTDIASIIPKEVMEDVCLSHNDIFANPSLSVTR